MLFGMAFGISQSFSVGWDGMKIFSILGWDGMGRDKISKILGWDGMRFLKFWDMITVFRKFDPPLKLIWENQDIFFLIRVWEKFLKP